METKWMGGVCGYGQRQNLCLMGNIIFTELQKSQQPRQIVSSKFVLCTLQDAQKSTLMDMEIADYERLVKELNQKITDKDSRIEDLEQETGIQKQKQETLQEEISE